MWGMDDVAWLSVEAWQPVWPLWRRLLLSWDTKGQSSYGRVNSEWRPPVTRVKFRLALEGFVTDYIGDRHQIRSLAGQCVNYIRNNRTAGWPG